MKYANIIPDVEKLVNLVKTDEVDLGIFFYVTKTGEVQSFGFGDKMKAISILEIMKTEMVNNVIQGSVNGTTQG